jgi:hypothetical protein
MFSSKTSRSQSVNSIHSAGDFEIPPPNMDDQNDPNDEGQDVPNTQRWGDDVNYRFTAGHPLGNTLLKLVTDLTNIARKNNIKSMVTNADELCSDFYNGMRLERAKLNNKYENTVNDVERILMDKELNSHSINASVIPPQRYSQAPVLTSPQKTAEIMKIFPKPSKFSGNLSRDGHMSVVEFLNSLTAAQKQCNLTEEEFIDRILACSTGMAHDLIMEWKANGENASTIYHSLLVNFDNRMTAEEARQKLNSFSIGKNSNLAKAESSIQILVGRAASMLPPGDSRNAYRNMEGCTTLIRSLPPYSSLTANNLYQNYTTRLGRACTMAELFRGLDQYRGMIDRDIKNNGASIIQKYKIKPAGNQRYSSFNITTDGGNTRQYGRPLPPQPMARTRQNDISYTPKPINRNIGRSSRPQGGRFGSNYNKNGPQNNNRNSKYVKNDNASCPLCGKNHKITDCKNIRDDSGKILDMHPTYGVCSKCPNFVRPRLHHPEVVCPYRVGGPLNKNKNN